MALYLEKNFGSKIFPSPSSYYRFYIQCTQVSDENKYSVYFLRNVEKKWFLNIFCKLGQLFTQVQLISSLTKYPVLYRTGTLKYSAGNATDKKSLANCLQ